MRFAITDIETVGSKPGQGTIIEIAICIHDGEKVIDKYETLINPEKKNQEIACSFLLLPVSAVS